jgi:octaprenyl-diphosphate synthase
VKSFIDTVRQEAAKIDAFMAEDLTARETQLDPLLTEILRYGLFTGGKRIRPLLVVLAAGICGGERDRSAYRLGCAFEYLHAATLFHDDIIDTSATRRGKPSVYRRYGINAAILAGDFLHAWAMAIVGELTGREGLAVFCQATTGMVDGEFLQLRNAQRLNLSEEDYSQAIMGKTGLLIAAACEVGALFAGAAKEQAAALRAYGEHLGRAFQIIDDLLDYQGDPRKTGKAVGNDLNEGKVTLPLILALSKAGTFEKARLLEIFSDHEARRRGFAEVSQLIEGGGGFSGARQRAEAAVAGAIASLEHFVIADQGGTERELLVALAGYLLTREK